MPRLTRLQWILWLAVVTAAVASAVLVLSRRPAGEESAMGAAFRPEFALADDNGQRRSSDEFRGRFILVFFGFTTCPDVCPTTLSEVAQVMDELGPDAARVQPIFISVDPERDRRLGLRSFTEAFHPAILSLAGDEAATAAAAESFKVFFGREADASAPDGYTMSHSPALYLVGPDGDWIRHFTYGTPASEILADLKARL
jgi:protein SCO1/2